MSAVERIGARVYTVPTDDPEGDGTLTWDSSTLVLVEAVSGPHTGLGWTYGAAATAAVVRQELARLVTGRDAHDTSGAQEAMGRAVRNTGRPGLVAGAISAVDLALWDLRGHLLGLPLATLLGGAPRPVAVYGSGGFTTYSAERAARQLRYWTAGQGIPRVKIKIGESWGGCERRDLERVRAARAVIGDEVELYTDANGGYRRKQAVRVGAALAEEGVLWYEEPVSSDDPAGLAEVRAAVRPDVTAGEYGYDPAAFARMVPVVDCLQADATRCGGLTGWLRAAALAQAYNLDVSAHCAPHLHAHAAAAVPNCRHLEWFHDHVRVERLLFDGTLDPGGGTVTPGADGSPGHGLRLAQERAAPYRTG
ncbi:mandelate racemase [Kitasatospora sp. MMS16-BH015]|uniref:enolase C-terminal domain-like protein n=1 Tax=Kitasatospora sp. MMS16-BH015 TaxID=2018025 RepID=UPI000CA10AB7|nr:enolase C-terminal domain-like protein [Kitasatospora sp. MMS16-BH015]AUG81693.1 mandelate racemase [Kitasatospora sp. MMS16-BH015]